MKCVKFRCAKTEGKEEEQEKTHGFNSATGRTARFGCLIS